MANFHINKLLKQYIACLFCWFEDILLYIIQMIRTQVLTTYEVFTTKQTIYTNNLSEPFVLYTIPLSR